MAKRKKTRQQKIIADLRRKLQMEKRSVSSEMILDVKHGKDIPVKTSQDVKPALSKYPYLMHDLYKTGILTGGIIIAQLVLLFLLKNYIVVLPMVRY